MREPLTPFAYDASGRVYVCADGPEIYVWSGVDDSPLWRDFVDGILVDVAVVGDTVLAVDSDGVLTTWRIFDGQRVDTQRHDVAVHGLSPDPAGGVVLVVQDAVRLMGPGGLRCEARVRGATVAACDPSARLVVGTAGGRVVWLDKSSGVELGAVTLGGPVHDVVWSVRGVWIVGVGDQVVTLAADPDPDAVQGMVPAGGPAERISVSQDGWLVAVRNAREQVRVHAFVGGQTVATLTYTREVGDLAFGPGTWLAVVLEGADLNRLELGTGRITKNAAGLGRAADPWSPSLSADPAEIRGVIARSRAGGEAVAVQVVRPKGNVYGPPKASRPWLIPVVIGAAAFFCCGSSVVSAVVFALVR